MSPASRGRQGKRKKTAGTRRYEPQVRTAIEPCDCPACSGEVAPEEMAGDILDAAAELMAADDPLDAELLAATIAASITVGGAEDDEIDAFVAQITAPGGPGAVVLSLGLGAVAPGRLGQEATKAADDLIAAGAPRPRWADELTQPVTVTNCQAIVNTTGAGTLLGGAFHRADRSHAMIVAVDDTDCGAAADIMILDGDMLPEAMESAITSSRRDGTPIKVETLDPAEFRWRVERALDARAVHDAEAPAEALDELISDDEGPPYAVLAPLLRARMAALPAPTKPPAPHGGEDAHPARTPLEGIAGRIGRSGRADRAGRSRASGAKLPPKRTKSAGPAPIYQLKVSLRGAQPPIWRRLEVPADISLPRLHRVLQVAFDWEDYHLHAYETPFGRFGDPDPDLDQRSERSVTLEQVAPSASDKIIYTYDFGDDWEHEIVVEKVLDRDPAAAYPRCTGGRRAAPPEDCGGVWGYANLIDTLANPDDPEHDDMVEWLGLDDPADFDPAAFDPEAVTRALTN
ncbi:plasmid pRiA4b ORF-3 family protein [Actinomycetes bacterium KLBMP 9797]